MSKEKKVHWKITINNPTKEDEEQFKSSKFKYAIFGRETGEQGTPHLQGMVSCHSRMLFTSIKKHFPRANIQSAKDAGYAAYCKKDGDFIEYGEVPLTGGQQTKLNWTLALQQAKSQLVNDIDPCLLIRYYNTFNKIASDNAPKVSSIDNLANEWHFGPTGTGKSRLIREKYPDAFIKDADKWFDGYKDEETLIIEDIDKYDVKLGRQIKLWGDHYAFPASFKHAGKRDIRPKLVIITSNYTPRQIWDDSRTYEPIERRYKLIDHTPIDYPLKQNDIPWEDKQYVKK